MIKKGLKKEEAEALKAKLEAGIASHSVTLFSALLHTLCLHFPHILCLLQLVARSVSNRIRHRHR